MEKPGERRAFQEAGSPGGLDPWIPPEELRSAWEEIDRTAKEDLSRWNSFYAVESRRLSPEKRALFEEIEKERMGASMTIAPEFGDADAEVAGRNWRKADLLVRRWIADDEEITLDRIRELNRTLGQGLRFNSGDPGKIRKRTVGLVFREDGIYRPFIDEKDLPSALDLFFMWLKENEPLRNPIELAALAGERFVSVHPFLDGNGRTAGLICDWILMRHGIPPVIFTGSDKIFGVFSSIKPEFETAPGAAAATVTRGLKRFHGKIGGPQTVRPE